jgi:large subunit ribosomal protein L30
MAKKFKVTLKKSLRGTTQDQREAVRCLGLRRLNSEVIVADNPANRGQIYKVHHLVAVQPVK